MHKHKAITAFTIVELLISLELGYKILDNIFITTNL